MKASKAALGGVVGGHSGECNAGGDAEIVDDHTSLPKIREQGLGDQKRAVQVGVDHLAPGGEVQRGDGLGGTGDAGVVDEHVEAAGRRTRRQAGRRIRGRECHRRWLWRWAGARQGGRAALAAGGEDEMVAAFGEGFGDGETEAARGSGDESELGACGHGEESSRRRRLGERVGRWRDTGPRGVFGE